MRKRDVTFTDFVSIENVWHFAKVSACHTKQKGLAARDFILL